MDNLNTLDIIKIIIKNWKQIAFITIIGMAAGIIVSLIKKPLFKSQAVLFPYNITQFSEESPTETLDEFVESPEMMYLMDVKFKLGKHYGLDSASISYKENLKQLYQENFNYSLTSNRSLEIEVYDTDPKLAQKYCQGVIKCIDEMFTLQLSLKSMEELKLWQIQLNSTNNKTDSLRITLKEMSEKYGLLNFLTQSKEASKVQYKIISKGQSTTSNKEFNDLLIGLRTKGFEFYMLDKEYNSLIKLRSEAIVNIAKIERDLKKKFTYSMVVSAPDLPIKKSKPIRWIIVLSFTVSSFIFGLLLLFLRENKIFEKLNA